MAFSVKNGDDDNLPPPAATNDFIITFANDYDTIMETFPTHSK